MGGFPNSFLFSLLYWYVTSYQVMIFCACAILCFQNFLLHIFFLEDYNLDWLSADFLYDFFPFFYLLNVLSDLILWIIFSPDFLLLCFITSIYTLFVNTFVMTFINLLFFLSLQQDIRLISAKTTFLNNLKKLGICTTRNYDRKITVKDVQSTV